MTRHYTQPGDRRSPIKKNETTSAQSSYTCETRYVRTLIISPNQTIQPTIMSDLKSIMQEKARANQVKAGKGRNQAFAGQAHKGGPGSLVSSSHGSMPEVPALDIKQVPILKGADPPRGTTLSLSEYMARRRGSGSQYAGSIGGSVRSVETTQSMVEMSKELAMNRQELTALKKDNREIKELLVQLLNAQRTNNDGQK